MFVFYTATVYVDRMKGSVVWFLAGLVTLFATEVCGAQKVRLYGDEQPQRRSVHSAQRPSVPRPFIYGAPNPDTLPAISTGYYAVDTDDVDTGTARPSSRDYVDTLIEPGTWKRILSGPNQRDDTFWTDPDRNTYGGRAYLHNPADLTDSTDNAFAGPIAIGFPFYMNGIRYDSFYVSTNGLIALSNRRYHYVTDPFGWGKRRDVRPNALNALSVYDDESDDPRFRTAISGDTIDDMPDDWGYTYTACGGDLRNPRGGIRSPRNTMLTDSAIQSTWSNTVQGAYPRPALIAACWDDWQVSVYDSGKGRQDDFSRMYFKRSPSGEKLVVAWFNLIPVGNKVARQGTWMQSRMFQPNNRPGHDGHYSVSVQVHLNRRDSSITVHFGDVKGVVKGAQGFFAASDWVRCNATIGVYGQARRHTNRGDTASTTMRSAAYEQATEYLCNDETDSLGGVRVGASAGERSSTPSTNLAIKFKQWRNRLRVVSTAYAIIERNNDSGLSFSRIVPPDSCDGFEMLSADNRLDGVVPVVVVQNLANDIQGTRGVNASRPDEAFRVRVRFINQDGRVRYNASKIVTRQMFHDATSGVSLCDAYGTTIPVDRTWAGLEPYDYVRVAFPLFVWIAAPDGDVGKFTMYASIDPRDTVGVPIGEDWTLDDTLTHTVVRFARWYPRGWEASFADGFTAFDLSNQSPSPVIHRWVGRGVDVVDGMEMTIRPQEPTGEARAENDQRFVLRAPVLRLDRLDRHGREIPPPGAYGGDELRSVPIDISRAGKAALSFSYQRTGRITSRDRGFADRLLVGPEHRVVARDVTQTEPFERKPDELIVEFARPSDDGINGITNIADWRFDPAGLDSLYTPAYRVFGGGGFVRGFDSIEYNRQIDRTATPKTGGLHPDIGDDGKDEEWHHVYIPVPDTIVRWRNGGNRAFRFRLRASCLQNAATADVEDDNDPFYVDNVALLTDANGEADLHVMDVRMHWPYTMTPQRQLLRVPVSVRLANNAPVVSRNARVDVTIRDRFDTTMVAYRHTLTLDSVAAGECRRHALPPVDLSRYKATEWELMATVKADTPDQVAFNDTVRSKRRMVTGPAFAYEQTPEGGWSDVPMFADAVGKGLCAPQLRATADERTFWYAGQGTMPVQYQPYTDWRWGMPTAIRDALRFGSDADGDSVAVAMQFTLMQPDTIHGYQAWWGGWQSTGYARYAVFKDIGGRLADTPLVGTTAVRPRGVNDLSATNEPVFNAYSTVLLDTAVALDSGTYWLSVAQLGQDGFHLGASASRSAAVITALSDRPSEGVSATNVWIDHELSTRSEFGRQELSSRFAVRGTDGSWHMMMPRDGQIPFPHHNATGSIGYVMTWTQGGWIPMVRPYMEARPRTVVSVDVTEADADAYVSPAGDDDRLRDKVGGGQTIDADGSEGLRIITTADGMVHVSYPGTMQRVQIVDMQGRTVLRAAVAEQDARRPFAWDGRDAAASFVSSGRFVALVHGNKGTLRATFTVLR